MLGEGTSDDEHIDEYKRMISNKAGVQAAIGSNMLQLPATFSQLAHSVHSLAALNTVPGNSYSYARPSKLQLTAGVASDQGLLPVAPPSGTPHAVLPHICVIHV